MGRCPLALLSVFLVALAAGQAGGKERVFTDAECLACHEQKTAALVAQWRSGPHRENGCSACHGNRHDDAVRARQGAAI